MRLSEARAIVYTMVGDSPSAPAYASAADIDAFIHEAIATAARDCILVSAMAEAELIDGTAQAYLPDGFIQAELVQWDDKQLTPTTRSSLERHDGEWESRIGEPELYFMDTLQGRIQIWPQPSETVVDQGTPTAPSNLLADVETVGGTEIPPQAPSDLEADPGA